MRLAYVQMLEDQSMTEKKNKTNNLPGVGRKRTARVSSLSDEASGHLLPLPRPFLLPSTLPNAQSGCPWLLRRWRFCGSHLLLIFFIEKEKMDRRTDIQTNEKRKRACRGEKERGTLKLKLHEGLDLVWTCDLAIRITIMTVVGMPL